MAEAMDKSGPRYKDLECARLAVPVIASCVSDSAVAPSEAVEVHKLGAASSKSASGQLRYQEWS